MPFRWQTQGLGHLPWKGAPGPDREFSKLVAGNSGSTSNIIPEGNEGNDNQETQESFLVILGVSELDFFSSKTEIKKTPNPGRISISNRNTGSGSGRNI